MTVYFLTCLGLTLALEVPYALLWGLRGRDLLLSALVNVLTNPVVVLLHLLVPAPWMTALAECAAVAVEGLCYRSCADRAPHPMLLALGANVFSFCTGLALFGGI